MGEGSFFVLGFVYGLGASFTAWMYGTALAVVWDAYPNMDLWTRTRLWALTLAYTALWPATLLSMALDERRR